MTSKGLDFYKELQLKTQATEGARALVYWIIPPSYGGLPTTDTVVIRRDIFAASEEARMAQPVR